MDLKAIEYVCAIVEAKTISQAAKNLFISQPALSQYLNKIEKALGTPIFERSGNSLTLTSAGEILVRDGNALLMSRNEMIHRIEALSEEHIATLRFGVSPFYSKYYLPLLFSYYSDHHPNIRLDIIEMNSLELEQMVLDDKLDLCFIPAEPAREGLSYQPIHMEEIMIAVPASHPVNTCAVSSAYGSYLDITLLRNEPFIELVDSLKFSIMSRRILCHFSLSPTVKYKSTSWDTVCMLVAQGIGVGFLPEVLIRKHIHEPNFYHIAGIDSTRTYCAVHAKEKSLSHEQLHLISVFKSLLEKN